MTLWELVTTAIGAGLLASIAMLPAAIRAEYERGKSRRQVRFIFKDGSLLDLKRKP